MRGYRKKQREKSNVRILQAEATDPMPSVCVSELPFVLNDFPVALS